MIVHNKEFEAKSKLRRMILFFITSLSVGIIVYLIANKDLRTEQEQTVALGIGGAIVFSYFLYNVIQLQKKHLFIYYSDEGGKFTFRFYPIKMFTKNFKAIEIPFNEYYDHEITAKGKKNGLILKMSRAGKIVAYPPISINALTKEQISQITSSLNKQKSY